MFTEVTHRTSENDLYVFGNLYLLFIHVQIVLDISSDDQMLRLIMADSFE